MVLTEKQLYNYMKCPVYYQGAYEYGLIPVEQPSMSSLLSKVAHAFCAQLASQIVPSKHDVEKMWDRVCRKHQDYITEKRVVDGITALMQMYRWAEDKQLMIGSTDIPYKIVFKNDDPIELAGKISIVAVTPDKKMELLVIDFSRKPPDRAVMDMKLKYTMDVYAFKKLMDKDIGIHIHHVRSAQDFFTYRANDDFLRLESAVTTIGKCIKEKIYFPRENAFCSSCDMRNYCRAWK